MSDQPDPVTSSPGRDLPPFEDEDDEALAPDGQERHGALGMGEEDGDLEEDDGEHLFGDNMEDDYRPMPALDRYERDLMDDEEYDDMSEGDRAAAEADLRRRDREEGRLDGRMRRGLLYDSDDEDDEPARRRRRLAAERAADGRIIDEEDGMDGVVESVENLEDTRGRPVRDHVSAIGPKTECYNRFKNFLRTYVDARGHNLYKEKIRTMCEQNQASFEVDYNILASESQVLAYFLPEAPTEVY